MLRFAVGVRLVPLQYCRLAENDVPDPLEEEDAADPLPGPLCRPAGLKRKAVPVRPRLVRRPPFGTDRVRVQIFVQRKRAHFDPVPRHYKLRRAVADDPFRARRVVEVGTDNGIPDQAELLVPPRPVCLVRINQDVVQWEEPAFKLWHRFLQPRDHIKLLVPRAFARVIEHQRFWKGVPFVDNEEKVRGRLGTFV